MIWWATGVSTCAVRDPGVVANLQHPAGYSLIRNSYGARSAEACHFDGAVLLFVSARERVISGENNRRFTVRFQIDRGDVFEELDDYLSTMGGRVNWLASMAQDVNKGRRSEIDQMNGFVSHKGREVAVPTPFNDAIDAIIDAMHSIDDGSLKPDPSNVDRILKAVGR